MATWRPRDGFANGSHVARDPEVVVAARGDRWVRFDLAARHAAEGELTLAALQALLGDAPFGIDACDAPEAGGWFGWIGYEAAHALGEAPRPLPATPRDAPDLWLMRARRVEAVADPAEAARALAAASTGDEARRRAADDDALAWYRAAYAAWLDAPAVGEAPDEGVDRGAPPPAEPILATSHDARPPSSPARCLDRPAWEDAVRRLVAWILAGDVYQANLVRRVDPGARVAPAELFAALGRDAPVSHAALVFDGGGHAIVAHSPELLLRRRRDGLLETRPIKGTRRLARHRDPVGVGGGARAATATAAAASTHDAASTADAAALLASPKDRAEHLMIVDLERNDLGRVADVGSVRVERLFEPLPLAHLVHLESTVVGRPRDGVGALEALVALFPGGSITGAPKRRAMELIRELEPTRRGVAMGAVGWIGRRSLHLNVAIRTATRGRDGAWHFHVGGGITVDSDPAAEWDETEAKARALHEALESGDPAPPPRTG